MYVTFQAPTSASTIVYAKIQEIINLVTKELKEYKNNRTVAILPIFIILALCLFLFCPKYSRSFNRPWDFSGAKNLCDLMISLHLSMLVGDKFLMCLSKNSTKAEWNSGISKLGSVFVNWDR